MRALKGLPRARPATPAVDDHSLVRAAVAGDAEAFRALVERHHRVVFSICSRSATDPESALELAQDVFLRVFRSLPEFEYRSSFVGWASRIAVNRCRDHWKSAESRVRRRERAIDGLTVVIDGSHGPEGAVIAEERRRIAARLVDEMPPSLREPFLLRDVDGLEYDDVAAALGIRPGAARMRVCRAREWLAERFAEREGR